MALFGNRKCRDRVRQGRVPFERVFLRTWLTSILAVCWGIQPQNVRCRCSLSGRLFVGHVTVKKDRLSDEEATDIRRL